MSNLISREWLIEAVEEGWIKLDTQEDYNRIIHLVRDIAPSAQPTLFGYNVEHLELIARVLRKENLPPEKVAEALTNISMIVAIVRDEFEETLRKAAQNVEWKTEGTVNIVRGMYIDQSHPQN